MFTAHAPLQFLSTPTPNPTPGLSPLPLIPRPYRQPRHHVVVGTLLQVLGDLRKVPGHMMYLTPQPAPLRQLCSRVVQVVLQLNSKHLRGDEKERGGEGIGGEGKGGDGWEEKRVRNEGVKRKYDNIRSMHGLGRYSNILISISFIISYPIVKIS